MCIAYLVTIMRKLLLLATAVAFGAVACSQEVADDEESDQDVVSIDVSKAKVVEAGRFVKAGHAERTLEASSVTSLRMNGFGKTRIQVTAKSADGSFAPVIAIEGPVPGRAKVVASKVGRKASGASLDVVLEERGAYRILVGTSSSFKGKAGAAGGVVVDAKCLANCDLPEIPLADVVADLKAKVGPEALERALDAHLAQSVQDPELRARISAGVHQAVSGGGDVSALPVVPMSALGAAQVIFDRAPSQGARPAEGPSVVSLDDVKKGCAVTREKLAPVNPSLPGLETGEPADYSYDDCSLARLEGLARVLNAVSLGNGGALVDGAARYESVDAVVRMLIESGHHVVVDNSRYYADFLGLSYEGKTVMAPVWVDTGIAIPGGGTLRVPAPHAHHNVFVDGPVFRGQLKFYLGAFGGGTAFRAQSNLTRHWSGGRAQYTYDSATDADKVVKVLSLAGDLRKKWQAEGRSLPNDGYGTLGVCTDSTAVLEQAMEGKVTLFPLAHPKVTTPRDDLDRVLQKIPSDLAGFEPGDATRRIRTSLPFDSLEEVPFPAVRASLGRL